MSASPARVAAAVWLLGLAGCGGDPTGAEADAGSAADAAAQASDAPVAADPDASPTGDASADAASAIDAMVDLDAAPDAMVGLDAASPDALVTLDASPDAAPPPDAMTGIISGGPCMSGAAGATAYRVRWAGSGGTAYPVYEVNGLPDTSRDHTGAYSQSFNYTPAYVDTFLAQGGLQVSGTVFVDIELSTAGIAQIDTATLSIYGRSYNTTTSGSFTWQTFAGTGAAPTNLVANSAPYEWYSADMTTELEAGDDGVLLRIRAGPSSNALVVNRIELCLQAN